MTHIELIQQINALAVAADEAGHVECASALLLLCRASTLPPAVKHALVNTGHLMLDCCHFATERTNK